MGALKSEQVNNYSFTVNLAKNILQLMKKKKVSDSDLARALGLPYNTIKRITSGETTDPKISTLNMIADFFGVGVDALLEDTNHNLANSNKNRLVPILSWQDLEKPNILQSITPNNWSNWQPIAISGQYNLGRNSFAIQSRKSMQPRFPNGTIFIIDPDEKPSDGDIVLVKINKTKELTLKELMIDPPHCQLLPLNDNLTALMFENEKYNISGVVVFTMLHSR